MQSINQVQLPAVLISDEHWFLSAPTTFIQRNLFTALSFWKSELISSTTLHTNVLDD